MVCLQSSPNPDADDRPRSPEQTGLVRYLDFRPAIRGITGPDTPIHSPMVERLNHKGGNDMSKKIYKIQVDISENNQLKTFDFYEIRWTDFAT